jgi:hypothetical protein
MNKKMFSDKLVLRGLKRFGFSFFYPPGGKKKKKGFQVLGSQKGGLFFG